MEGSQWVSDKRDGDGRMPRVLITGCMGQIGVELVPYLRQRYGNDNVVASDIQTGQPAEWAQAPGPFERLDVTRPQDYEALVSKYRVDYLVHNAAILSGTGEKNFELAMRVNIRGLETALELARAHRLRIYVTSSIAAFGPESGPKELMPDVVAQRPTTIYGISKLYAEALGSYYRSKWGVDFRCMRFPGIVSWKQCPSGGTTDFSTEMFYYALQGQHYVCPLRPDTRLPMMYMDDALKATADILEAPREQLRQCVYNVNAFALTPRMVEEAVRAQCPNWTCSYVPDFRQGIAESWPQYMDDHNAREQWGWSPRFTAPDVFADMFKNLRVKLNLNVAH
eukprot:m51a1_g8208 Threonine dehydrogenase (338) ;pseudo; r:57996-59498